MADPINAPKKSWWEWLLKDVIISGVVAAGLDVAIKNLGPKALEKISTLLGQHVTKKYIEDKRAEIVADLQEMETSAQPINVDNLWARHEKAIRELREDRFIILLCKLLPDRQDPSLGRQKALKWLNDMDDAKFNQTLFMLDQDNHIQAIQRWRDRGARIRTSLSASLKTNWQNFRQWMRTRFGTLGSGIISALEGLFDCLADVLVWLFDSGWRIAFIALLSIPIAIFMALFIRPVRRRVFPWLAIANGVLLITLAYYLLVPTSLDKTLSLAMLMLLAAAFFLWRFVFVRNAIFGLLFLFTIIFFLNGRTAAKEKMFGAWDHLQGTYDRAGKQGDQRAIAALKANMAARDEEIAKLRHEKASKSSAGTPGGDDMREGGESSLNKQPSGMTATSDFTEHPGHCVTNQGSDPPVFAFGNYRVVLQHCRIVESQIIFSGLIEWDGDGDKEHQVSFHAFRISDPAGNTYEVQNGKLGKDENFGMRYSTQPLDAKNPLAFSFKAGPVDTKSIPEKINLIMPNTQGDLGNVGFIGIKEKMDAPVAPSAPIHPQQVALLGLFLVKILINQKTPCGVS